MKKFLLLLSVVALAFTSCYEDMGPVEPDVNDIQLETTSLRSEAAGGTFSVTVTSDYAWEAYTSSSWITIHTLNGNPGTSSLMFTLAANNSTQERDGVISVFCDAYNLNVNLYVTQYGAVATSGCEFALEATNIGETSATLRVHPLHDGCTFYWNVKPESDLKEFATTAAYMQDWYAYMKELVDAGYYKWSDLLDNTAVELDYDRFNPGTKYVLYAFGIDANGKLTSTDLSYVVFETKKSSFDTTSWYGYWNVTSPMHLSITGTSLEVMNRPLDKVIAITDASADFGEGYVYVWGWDGVFELELPALGMISSNTIKLMNNVVLFTENNDQYGPLDYTWQGNSYLESYGDWYMIGGNYSCYTLTMGTDGKSASVKAFQGQLTNGTEFMTDYYCLAGVITTGQYEGYALSFSRNDGQPALYLSGAEMAVSYLAPIDTASVKKLEANKKGKLYTMMATPKAVAHYSAAVKFASIK